VANRDIRVNFEHSVIFRGVGSIPTQLFVVYRIFSRSTIGGTGEIMKPEITYSKVNAGEIAEFEQKDANLKELTSPPGWNGRTYLLYVRYELKVGVTFDFDDLKTRSLKSGSVSGLDLTFTIIIDGVSFPEPVFPEPVPILEIPPCPPCPPCP